MTKHLITEANFHRVGEKQFRSYQAGDDFYQRLIDMHRDLSDEKSTELNAKLILLLANHVGDLDVLEDAMAMAVKSLNN